MTTTPNPIGQRLPAVAVAVCMGGAGVALAFHATPPPAPAPVETVAHQPEGEPAHPPLWRQSETRIRFTNGADQVDVLIRDGALEVRVNGEVVGEDRLERAGDAIRVLDEQGEPIVALRRTPGGGWSIAPGPLGPDALQLLPLRPFIDRLEPAPAQPTRPRLGVTLAPVDAATAEALGVERPEAAALIRAVAPDSPAQQAGLRAADVILAIEGDENMPPARVVDRVTAADPNETITLRIRRGADTLDVRVQLAGEPQPPDDRPRRLVEPFRRLPGPFGEDWLFDRKAQGPPRFRLFPDDFVGPEPLAEMERILEEIERLRQRLRDDFAPFGFIERDGPMVIERLDPDRAAPPGRFRFDFGDGFIEDFRRRMEKFQQRMDALGAQMSDLGRRIARAAREDAGPAFAAQARDAFTPALADADALDADARQAVRRAFEAALKATLDNAHWSYDSDTGVVELSQPAADIARRLARTFDDALAGGLNEAQREQARAAVNAAADALAAARATLSHDARTRIDALFERMRSLQDELDRPGAEPEKGQEPANDLPVKKDAKKAAA